VKILQVNKFFYVHGGVDTYYFNLISLLESRGHRIVHFAMQDPRNRPSPYVDFFVSNVNLREPMGFWNQARAAGRILYSFEARRKIGSLLDREEPQLVHLHHIYHQLSPSILPVIKARGLPVILTLHDYKLICPNYSLLTHGRICERCAGCHFYHAVIHRCVQDSLLKSALCTVEMYAHRLSGIYLNNVDLFLAPSRFLRDKMIQYGMSAQRIAYVPNFVPAELYEPSFEHRGYYVFVGRLERIKGVETLVRAAVRAGRPGDLELWIVGTGREEERLRRLACRLGAEHIHFVGFKSGQELADVVRDAAFAVAPSEWYENAPLSVLESFAYGKSVIASRIGGLPELVEDGRTGLLFRAGDVAELQGAIESLASSPKRIVALGREARRCIETDFGSDAQYTAIMRAYKRVMKQV